MKQVSADDFTYAKHCFRQKKRGKESGSMPCSVTLESIPKINNTTRKTKRVRRNNDAQNQVEQKMFFLDNHPG